MADGGGGALKKSLGVKASRSAGQVDLTHACARRHAPFGVQSGEANIILQSAAVNLFGT